jgi:hypothetical protein
MSLITIADRWIDIKQMAASQGANSSAHRTRREHEREWDHFVGETSRTVLC